jgi:hypothetical protein
VPDEQQAAAFTIVRRANTKVSTMKGMNAPSIVSDMQTDLVT